jgi:Uncharacterized conserved protein
MKEYIKRLIFISLFFSSKVLYVLTTPFLKRQKSALILAPSWEGSKGDEAVIAASSRELKAKGFKVTLIHLGDHKEWAYLTTIDCWYGIPTYFSSGGWGTHFRFIGLFVKYSRFYLLGTDMLDGSYGEWLTNGLLRITHHAAFAGLKTNIVAISVNTWQNPSCLDAIRKLPSKVKIGVRDEISWQRLSDLIPSRNFTKTSDIAFILRPQVFSGETKKYVAWVNHQKEEGRLVFALNINPVSFDEKDQEQFFSLMNQAMMKLANTYTERFSFLFVPHDFREHRNDCDFLKMLFDRLHDDLKKYTLVVDKQITSEEIKAVVSGVDFAISSRMHLAVALLSQAIPAACLTYQPVKKDFTSYSDDIVSQIYQDKFDGLFRHFQLGGLVLTPEEALKPEVLNVFLDKLYNKRLEIQHKLQQHLPEVLSKSELNLE